MANLCIVNEDHLQCNVPRKAIKACQGRDRGALPLREWLCHPFSSTGLSSPYEFVLSQPQCHRHCRSVSESAGACNRDPGLPAAVVVNTLIWLECAHQPRLGPTTLSAFWLGRRVCWISEEKGFLPGSPSLVTALQLYLL